MVFDAACLSVLLVVTAQTNIISSTSVPVMARGLFKLHKWAALGGKPPSQFAFSVKAAVKEKYNSYNNRTNEASWIILIRNWSGVQEVIQCFIEKQFNSKD